MFSVAVVGCGSIGRRHIRNLLALGCEVFGADISEDAMRQLPSGARAFRLGHGSGFAASDFSAVVVAVPIAEHLSWAEFVIDSRVPLFLEKPVGQTTELQRWHGLVEQSRELVTQVGYQCRFHPYAKALKTVPAPDRGHFETRCDTRTWPGSAYGPFVLEASHDIDLALANGAPTTVTAAAIDRDFVRIDLGGRWTIRLENYAQEEYRRLWDVGHDASAISARFLSPYALGEQMYVDEMAHFLECVKAGRQTDVPLSEGVKVLDVVAQAERLVRQAA